MLKLEVQKAWKKFFKGLYSALQAYSEKCIPMGKLMSFELSVASGKKRTKMTKTPNKIQNPDKPTATKIWLPLPVDLNPNCKAELCKLCETGWNPNANPNLASGSGAPSQTDRSVLVRERLVKPDESAEPPEGRVCKLKRGDGHTGDLSPESSSVPEFLGPGNQA